MGRHKNRFVLSYFNTLPNDEKVECKICKKRIQYKSSTWNLKRHLTTLHYINKSYTNTGAIAFADISNFVQSESSLISSSQRASEFMDKLKPADFESLREPVGIKTESPSTEQNTLNESDKSHCRTENMDVDLAKAKLRLYNEMCELFSAKRKLVELKMRKVRNELSDNKNTM